MMTEYSKSKLILLRYLNGAGMEDRIPYYFTTVHQLDSDECVNAFLSAELLEPATPSISLQKATVARIKEFAQKHGVKTSGKKDALIERIENEVPPQAIFSEFPRCYALTERGIQLLEENLTDDEFADRYSYPTSEKELSDWINLIHAGKWKTVFADSTTLHEKEKTINAFLTNSINDKNISLLSSEERAFCIIEVLRGIRTETAKKEYCRFFKVDISEEILQRLLRIVKSIDEVILNQRIYNVGFHQFYTIETIKDERTCSYCKKMYHKKIDYKNAVIGENYPPFNKCTCPYCRCAADSV